MFLGHRCFLLFDDTYYSLHVSLWLEGQVRRAANVSVEGDLGEDVQLSQLVPRLQQPYSA